MGDACDSTVFFYVATNGSDLYNGSLNYPFATLSKAQTAVRTNISGGMTSNAVVFVRGGTYNLTTEIKLIASDAGKNGYRVIWRNYYGETPVLRGGTTLSSFAPSAQPGVYEATVAPTVFSDGGLVLYWKGQLLEPARYPNAVTPNFGAADPWAGSYLKTSAGSYLTDNVIYFTPGSFDSTGWTLSNAQVVIFSGPNYGNSMGRINAINSAAGTMSVSNWGSYTYNLTTGNRFYIQGVRQLLDVPGEWNYDSASQKLYVYPPSGYSSGDYAVVPSANNAFNIDPSSNINISGFTVEAFRYAGVRIYNSGNITLSNNEIRNIGSNDNLHLPNPALSGLGVFAYSRSAGDAGFENILIENNIFHDIAAGGIGLESGPWTFQGGTNRSGEVYHFKTLTPTGNRIFGNRIYSIGQLLRGSAGLSVRTVGGLIANNTIYRLPRTGISLQGNDNIVEWNRVYDLNRETEDTGGINFLARSWLYRNNTVRHNFVHDMGGYRYNSTSNSYIYPQYAWGIYPDDFSSEVEIHDNVVARAYRGAFQIHAGRDNYIHDNIGVEGTSPQMYAQGEWGTAALNASFRAMWNELGNMTAWGFDTAKYYSKYPLLANAPNPGTMTSSTVYNNNRFERNVFYYPTHPSSALASIRYFVGGSGNVFDYNLVWNGGASSPFVNDMNSGNYQWASWLALGYDTHSVLANPLFTNPTADDYTFQPGSPAWALGLHNVVVPR